MIVNSSKYKSIAVYDLYEVFIQCFSALYMIENFNFENISI